MFSSNTKLNVRKATFFAYRLNNFGYYKKNQMNKTNKYENIRQIGTNFKKINKKIFVIKLKKLKVKTFYLLMTPTKNFFRFLFFFLVVVVVDVDFLLLSV